MNKKISIIIAVYNGEKFLRRCIDSLINQTYKNIEILIIDDGSTDDCRKICEQYARSDERVKYYYQKNSGVSSARNNGICKSSGDYITFVDSDDFVDINFCKVLIDGMNDEVQLSVVGNKAIFEKEMISTKLFEVSLEQCKKILCDNVYKYIFDDMNFFGFVWNKLYRKDLLKSLGTEVFDTKITNCEDTLVNVKYLQLCNKISYNPSKLYYYFQRENSASKMIVFNEKKLSIFDSLNQIENILKESSPNNLVYLYIFYLYNFYVLNVLLKKTKNKYNLNSYKRKDIYQYVLKSKQINFIKKIKIILKYRFPILNDLLFNSIKGK